MSYAAFKMMHWPTGIEHCAAGFITHSQSLAVAANDLEAAEWPAFRSRNVGSTPDLVVAAGNVLEIYAVRVEDGTDEAPSSSEQRRGGLMDGIAGARLELVCHYRLHGNIESMSVLSVSMDNRSNRRDSVVLAFRDAKIIVMEFDDSSYGLRTSSMHCFEGPDWQHLKRGRESFGEGPKIKADPVGRCCAVLIYDLQMIILKSVQVGQSLVTEEEPYNTAAAVASRIESSYVIDLRKLDMNHVKDFSFLHGYIEPVLVILQEKEPTWAGRLVWKHHTCSISAFSINTTLKQHPLIWSASNLPHDAYKLLAVPSPIGGVLVVAANSIHYHSQTASCSLALNNFSLVPDASTESPKLNFHLELDAANVTWLADDVAIFSSKNGELCMLTLIFDGRAVNRLELTKSKASVLTSSMTTIGSSFFFLGSRLGDSLLVQYSSGTPVSTSAEIKEEAMDIEGDVPVAKRARRMSPDVLKDINGVEELSLYSTGQKSSESAQKSFSFVVRDSLINVGPIRDFSYGLRINADSSASGLAKQSNYELVSCSGHAKNGALCVLYQTIRPDLITEVELSGCRGIWTVYHKSSRSHAFDSSKLAMDDDEYHSYLIISLDNRTMVLETADELGEVTETVDYYVHGCTIAAGNLFGRRRVIQIFPKGARILDGAYMTQELTFGSEVTLNSESASVTYASIADPYVLLKMDDGTLQLLIGDPSTCTVSLNFPSLMSTSTDPVTACTLYHDRGPEPWLRNASTDAWLSSGIADSLDGNDVSDSFHVDIYCLVCYESGKLEIFDVPGFKCLYSVDNFVSGKSILVDACSQNSVTADQTNVVGASENAKGSLQKELEKNGNIVEIAMHRWSGRNSRPFIFGVLNDGTIMCYHAYYYEASENNLKGGSTSPNTSSFASTSNGSRLRNLRFVRRPIDITSQEDISNTLRRPRINVFNNVGGYQGLFLSGSRPAWFMVFRERIRVHPQLSDGSVVAFAVLHNVNCSHGLIYVNSQGFLKICQLPSVCNYDNYWPVQKIPLLGTPHQVAYNADKCLYAVIVSSPVARPLNQVLSSMADQETGNSVDTDSIGSDDMYTIDEFEVRIFEPDKSGGRWEPRGTIPMQMLENALCVRVVTLHNTTTKENETLMAVGTAYVQGEDVAARGRILLFSFAKTTENLQNPVSEVYSKELKGAVSAVASLQGQLLIAAGPKITLHKWTGSELNGVAFYDGPLHIVSLNIVKNFILFGDIHKSIYFLNWKEQGAQLSLLAKDFGCIDCYATEFLIDGSTLSLVISDAQKNIQIFYYAPKMLESWKGQKLLPRADFHVGAHVTKFLRLQMLSTGAGSEKTNRFALLFSTTDGGIGCVVPLDELTFRRLQMLQKMLVDAVPHVGGLNPQSFRQFYANGRPHHPGPDNMVDFELLSHYEMLSLDEQLDIAHQIGTTRAQILANFHDLAVSTSFL